MNLGRLRILLVEDSPDDFVIIRETLIDSQLEVELIRTDTLADAIKHLHDSKFDCILLDLSLRDAEGKDVLASVIGESDNAAVIVLTGRDDDEMALQAIRDGAQDYLKKRAFDPDTFARAIHYAIQRKRMSLRLAVSQRRFALVAKATRDGIWDWDVEKNTLYAAARWYKMTGSRPQPFQYDLEHWLEKVHPDDRSGLEAALRDTPIHSEDPTQYEYRMQHSDGSYRRMMSRWVGITEGETVVRLVGAQSDITPKRVCSPTTTESQVDRPINWESEFQSGLGAGEFRLQYQPIVSMATREPISVEALVRWQHPRLGLLYPESFLPCAQSTSLMVSLSNYVLDQVSRDMETFPESIPRRVSINLSSEQLLDGNLTTTLESLSKKHKLQIEVKEKALRTSPVLVLQQLRALREFGITVALDDFGQSSLRCLEDFPFDSVKLARSFVQDLEKNRSRIIIANLVRLAHELNLDVVAKGVESQQQHDLLFAMQCQASQGFFYSAPIFPIDLADLATKAG